MTTEMNVALQELEGARQKIAELTEAAKQSQINESSLTGKLRTCKEQLEGNEQMIRWLNSQVRVHTCCRNNGKGQLNSTGCVHPV